MPSSPKPTADLVAAVYHPSALTLYSGEAQREVASPGAATMIDLPRSVWSDATRYRRSLADAPPSSKGEMMLARHVSAARLVTSTLAALGLCLCAAVVSAPTASALSVVEGYLDSVTPNANGTIRVVGWAATRDAPLAQIGVRAKIDGTRDLLNFKVDGSARPDVKAYLENKYGVTFSNLLGFDKIFPAPSGTHTVCMEGQNSGVYNDLNTCRSYTIATFPGGSNSLKLFTGGAWAHTPGNYLHKTYTIANGTRSAAIQSGANSWTATSTRLFMDLSATVTSDSNDIVQAAIAQSWFALTTRHPSPGCDIGTQVVLGCTISWSRIDFNTNTITNDTQAQKTTAHELGHAFGLSHPPSGNASVMNQGVVGGNVTLTPSSFDVGDTNILYPNTYTGQ
jgi:hypothetical protein